MLIQRHPKKPGWFRVPFGPSEPLWGVPGTHLENGLLVAHQTHLPLLDPALANVHLARNAQPSEVWLARDAWCAERGFKLRTVQHQALDFARERRHVLLCDEMRIGKGHPAGTMILTPDGWRPIETLQVGALVFGSNGLPTKVTGVFPRGHLPAYKVTFSDGASVVVDADHLWAAKTSNDVNRGRPWRVVETRTLMTRLSDGAGNRIWRIPMVQPVHFPERRLPVDPYLLGVLLGDGSLTSAGLSFTPGDEAVPREVEKVLPSTARLSVTRNATRAACWRIIGDNQIDRALRQLGLMGLRSEDKFVPLAFMFSSVEQRLALLQGLMDTDGELYQQRNRQFVGFSSASAALASAVRFLVESLGGQAREGLRAEPKYTYRGERRIGQPSYRLTIAMPDGINPFRARQGYQGRAKYKPSRTIASIEPVGERDIYCISVDAADQLYVAERFIVTHNTLSALMMDVEWRRQHKGPTLYGPLLIIAPLATRAVWLGWAKRLYPDLEIGVIEGKTYQRETFRKPIVFGHYDVIHKWQAVFEVGTLILDEVQYLTNAESLRTKAAKTLSSFARHVVALTGTPINKFPPDMYAILDVVARGAWGSRYEFCQRYGNPQPTAHGTKYEGISNEVELKARLSEIMIRRLWRDVHTDLPPITRSVVVADLGQADRNRLDILAGKIKAEHANTAANLAAYRRQVATIKLPTVIKEVERVLDRGEPLVVWTWHKEFAEKIAAKLAEHERPVWMIHGEVAIAERERRMAEWRAHPCGVLVANMAVAGAGIDLSHAHITIFAEIDYTPSTLGQAEMRTYSPLRPMDVLFVVANHLVDQRIVRSLVAKLSATDPLGVAAAIDAIDALRDVVLGTEEAGDLDRLLEDLLAAG